MSKSIASSLPKVLVVVLEIVGKIGMGIRGWQMLWQEAKIHALGFGSAVQQILKFMAEGFRQIFSWVNVGGMFDGAIEGLQKFVNDQDAIIAQLEKDRAISITNQAKGIKDYKEEQAAIEGYKQTIGQLESKFKELATEEVTGAKKAVSAEKSKKAAIDNTTDAINAQIAAVIKLKGHSSGSFSSVESLAKDLDDEADK